MGDPYSDFYWQDGYGIFSVSPKRADTVFDYIKNQHIDHQKMSFKDEFRPFYKNYDIDFDDRYEWG